MERHRSSESNREVGLEARMYKEETKYMVVSRHQNVRHWLLTNHLKV